MAAKEKSSYTAADIDVLEGLEPVRQRPAMYIGGTGKAGYHHLLWEIVDNSIDEVINKHATRVDVTLHKDGSVEVADDGRGMDPDKLRRRDGQQQVQQGRGQDGATERRSDEATKGCRVHRCPSYDASSAVVSSASPRLVPGHIDDRMVGRPPQAVRVAGTIAALFDKNPELAHRHRVPADPERRQRHLVLWPGLPVLVIPHPERPGRDLHQGVQITVVA